MNPEYSDSISNTEVGPKAHTPTYDNSFGPNTHKLSHILRFSSMAVQGYLADLKAALSSLDVAAQTNPANVQNLTDIVKRVASNTSELTGGILASHEFLPVLMVAITEAYLKDVLVYAAGMAPTLMERDVKQLRRGGPAAWIKTLQKIGARGYRTETIGAMEALWGVRHLIVHSSSLVTHEFARRHPNFPIAVGSRFIVNANHLKQWFAAMCDFVEVNDRYFLSRCGSGSQS
jgi:hypothetical protein